MNLIHTFYVILFIYVMAVSYSRSKLFKKKMEKLLSLNHKNILLTKAVITDKAKSVFENLKKL